MFQLLILIDLFFSVNAIRYLWINEDIVEVNIFIDLLWK